jgi:trehalose 6-phosphate synthase
VAYYRLADVALVTPLNDGMNLVAKEYCAANVDETGALILSEFAGAAAELKHGALLVNPYDVAGMAAAMGYALTMPDKERRERMVALRSIVRRNDVHRWVSLFLDAATAPPGRAGVSERGNGFPRRTRGRSAAVFRRGPAVRAKPYE